MSISLHTVLAPFGVKPPSLCLGWQARFSLGARGAAVADGKADGLEKTLKEKRDLDVLYDDGFGSVTMKEYFTAARAMLKNDDGGPPRWFCPVECGCPKVESAPLLLFLPGMFFSSKMMSGLEVGPLLCVALVNSCLPRVRTLLSSLLVPLMAS
jgi:hypothetical protein